MVVEDDIEEMVVIEVDKSVVEDGTDSRRIKVDDLCRDICEAPFGRPGHGRKSCENEEEFRRHVIGRLLRLK